MRFFILTILASAVILLGVPKAKAFEALDVKITLPPMERPDDRPVGYKWVALKNGEPHVSTLISRKGNVETRKTSDGCQYSRFRGFAPSLKWSGCSGTDGEQEVKPLKGKIWPLAVGNTFKYEYSDFNDNGYSWVGTRKCTVKAQVRVKTGTGEHDTFKVVCTDEWSTRTWYYSPKLKTAVVYMQDHSRRGTNTYEMVRQEFPDSKK